MQSGIRELKSVSLKMRDHKVNHKNEVVSGVSYRILSAT